MFKATIENIHQQRQHLENIKIWQKLSASFRSLFWSVSFLLLGTTQAQALTFQELVKNIAEALSSVPFLLTILCYIIGIVLVISGIAYTNKAKNFPQQAEMSTGIWRIFVGVVLLALPLVINSIIESFGTGSTTIAKPTF